MPRVLHVINTYFAIPYFIGGQFKYFKDKKHEIHVICSNSEYLDAYSREMGFVYKTVEITRTYSFVKDLIAFIAIFMYIRKNKFEILIGHTPKGALYAMISGWMLKTPKRIYFRHGLVYETAGGFAKKMLIMVEKVTAYCSTEVICVSQSVYDVSLRDKLNSEAKQTILGKGTCNGIDTINKYNPEKTNPDILSSLRRQYKIGEKDFILGFCGRIVIDKGIIELINAFDLLRHRNSDRRFILLLVGVMEERDHLPSFIVEKIKTDTDIIHTGFINENIQNYYALMNIYILPSFREGFPTSVLEASAMEIPVLTTRATGCIDSIIESVTGKYIEINPLSITKGVEFYLNNPEQSIVFGKNGRDFVKSNFDNLTIWKELERVYS